VRMMRLNLGLEQPERQRGKTNEEECR
jgi:hypothetical protein